MSKKILVTNGMLCVFVLLSTQKGEAGTMLLPGIATPVDPSDLMDDAGKLLPDIQAMVDSDKLTVGAAAEHSQNRAAMAVMEGRQIGVKTSAAVMAANPVQAPKAGPGDEEDGEGGDDPQAAPASAGKPWEQPGKGKARGKARA